MRHIDGSLPARPRRGRNQLHGIPSNATDSYGCCSMKNTIQNHLRRIVTCSAVALGASLADVLSSLLRRRRRTPRRIGARLPRRTRRRRLVETFPDALCFCALPSGGLAQTGSVPQTLRRASRQRAALGHSSPAHSQFPVFFSDGGRESAEFQRVEGGTGIRHIRTDVSNFQVIHDYPRYLAGHNPRPRPRGALSSVRWITLPDPHL